MESTLSVSSIHEDKVDFCGPQVYQLMHQILYSYCYQVAILEGTVAQLQREKKELFDHYKYVMLLKYLHASSLGTFRDFLPLFHHLSLVVKLFHPVVLLAKH